MDSASTDGGDERKPSDVQLLVDLVSQQMEASQRQMEASQRREERFVALLEQMSATSKQLSSQTPAGAEPGGARSGDDGAIPGPAPSDFSSTALGQPGESAPSPVLNPPLPASVPGMTGAGVPSDDRGAADPGPALHPPLPDTGRDARAVTGHSRADLSAADPGRAIHVQPGTWLDTREGDPRGPVDSGPVRSTLPTAPGHDWCGPAGRGSAVIDPVDLDRDPGRTRARSRLPAMATPAPRLVSSASLRDFETWRSKFDGYRLYWSDWMSFHDQNNEQHCLLLWMTTGHE